MKLDQARKFALSLPEAVEAPHHELASFRIRGKIFATVAPGGNHLHIFVSEEQREPLIAAQPATYDKLWWGAKVAGLRVELASASAPVVKQLLFLAWSRKAPKSLLQAMKPETNG